MASGQSFAPCAASAGGAGLSPCPSPRTLSALRLALLLLPPGTKAPRRSGPGQLCDPAQPISLTPSSFTAGAAPCSANPREKQPPAQTPRSWHNPCSVPWLWWRCRARPAAPWPLLSIPPAAQGLLHPGPGSVECPTGCKPRPRVLPARAGGHPALPSSSSGRRRGRTA